MDGFFFTIDKHTRIFANAAQIAHRSISENSYNLRQKLTRQRELFNHGHVTQAEYEHAFLFIDRQLQRLQPSAQPEVCRIRGSDGAH